VSIRRCELPVRALHKRYQSEGSYADCYTTVVRGAVSQSQFVEAFYTTPLFKLERLILLVLLGKVSTDEEARRLAAGQSDKFAAWTVEARAEDQLLMCDFMSSTRSCLMTEREERDGDVVTRLYFGSVVVRKADQETGKRKMGLSFKIMLPFHKVYSRGLLAAAKFRVKNATPAATNR
jgi:hypothetical protein